MKQMFLTCGVALALGVAPLLAAAEDGSRPSNWSSPGPGAVDFGSVQTGQSSLTQVVTVRNSGTGPVTYTGFGLTQQSAGASFVVVPKGEGSVPACASGSVLAAGAACGLAVSFQPAAGPAGVGAKGAWLTPQFQAAAPEGKGMVNGTSPGARLAGTGVLPSGTLSPASLDFALTTAGRDAPAQFVTLVNTGLGPLNFVAAQLASWDARFGSFSLAPAANGGTPACAAGTPLPPGGSCSLKLDYHAAQAGSTSSRLSVALAGGALAPASVALTGHAGLPAVATRHN